MLIVLVVIVKASMDLIPSIQRQLVEVEEIPSMQNAQQVMQFLVFEVGPEFGLIV